MRLEELETLRLIKILRFLDTFFHVSWVESHEDENLARHFGDPLFVHFVPRFLNSTLLRFEQLKIPDIRKNLSQKTVVYLQKNSSRILSNLVLLQKNSPTYFNDSRDVVDVKNEILRSTKRILKILLYVLTIFLIIYMERRIPRTSSRVLKILTLSQQRFSHVYYSLIVRINHRTFTMSKNKKRVLGDPGRAFPNSAPIFSPISLY